MTQPDVEQLNNRRIQILELERDQAIALLTRLIDYADGMNPVPPVIYHARAFLRQVKP